MTLLLGLLAVLLVCVIGVAVWMGFSMLMLAHRIGEGKPRRRRRSDLPTPPIH